jgi:hypothetical protein
MEAPETRLCVICGQEFDADLFQRGDTPCGAKDEFAPCTLDMTYRESWEHWRKLAHERAARLAEVERELDLMKAAGIIEVAARNPSVLEYMQHWEGRAERREAALMRRIKIDNGCLLRNGQHHVKMRPVDYDPCEGLPCGCRQELDAALQQEGGE